MDKYIALIILLALCLASVACIPVQELPFSVLAEKISFAVTGTGTEPLPDLIIIASLDDIVSPTPVVEYSEAMMENIKRVDFDSSFIVLHLVGRIKNNGNISQILRRGNSIYIKLLSFSIGPGNYELEGFTLPYQMTSVSKKGDWGKEFLFILELEGSDILTQVKHYIP